MRPIVSKESRRIEKWSEVLRRGHKVPHAPYKTMRFLMRVLIVTARVLHPGVEFNQRLCRSGSLFGHLPSEVVNTLVMIRAPLLDPQPDVDEQGVVGGIIPPVFLRVGEF